MMKTFVYIKGLYQIVCYEIRAKPPSQNVVLALLLLRFHVKADFNLLLLNSSEFTIASVTRFTFYLLLLSVHISQVLFITVATRVLPNNKTGYLRFKRDMF